MHQTLQVAGYLLGRGASTQSHLLGLFERMCICDLGWSRTWRFQVYYQRKHTLVVRDPQDLIGSSCGHDLQWKVVRMMHWNGLEFGLVVV